MRFRLVLISAVAWCLSGGTGEIRAEVPGWELGPEGDDYLLDVYTSADGLPQNSVNDILQTRDGYIWLATFGGLARFDGVRFRVFDIARTPGLSGNRILSLHEAGDGTIWIGSQYGGLSSYRDGHFEKVDDGAGERAGVWHIAESRGGVLWLSTWRGLIRRSPDGSSETVSSTEGRPLKTFGLARSGDDIWVGTELGLARHVEGALELDSAFAQQAQDPQIRGIDAGAGGELWLATTNGAWARTPDGTFRRRTEDAAWEIGSDSEGGVWVVGESVERFVKEEGRETRISLLGRSLPFNVTCMLEDREGSIWLGSRGGGLLRLRRRVLRRLTVEDGLPEREVKTLSTDGSGGLWLGVGCGNLTHFDGERFTTGPFVGGRFCGGALLQARSGALWTNDERVLTRIDGESRREYPIDGPVGAVLEDRAGRIWVPMDDGLGFVDDEGITVIPAPAAEWNPRVMAMLEDRNGTLWIATSQGLVQFVDGRYRMFTSDDGLAVGPVRVLHESGPGTLWIGTYGGGLTRLKDGAFRRITSQDGLLDNFVSGILEDDEGNLWLNGNLGVSRVRRSELNAFADGRRQTIAPVLYDAGDGGAEGNGGSHPSGWRTEDGRLWFPTIDGLVSIDPRNRPRNLLEPPVFIEEIAIGDSTVAAGEDGVVVQPGQRDLRVRYTGLSFLRPDQVRFRYRLEGYDDGWVEAGTRRTAYYTDVPAGEYAFHVIAANGEGVWNKQGARISIRVEAPFWASSWFRTLSIAVVLSLLWIGYRTRIRSIQARNEALKVEAERRRAAEAQLRSVITNTPVVLFAIDAEGEFTLSEGRGLDALDLVPGEVVGHSAFDIYADNPTIVDNLRRCLAGEDRAWTSIIGDMVFHTRTMAIRDDEGRVTGLIGVGFDITDRVRAEEDRADLETRLRQMEKLEAVGQLAGGVAHDFNNLLMVIGGHAELLQGRLPADAKVWRSLDELQRAKDSAAGLTSQLLAFARRQTLHPVVIDLNEILHRTRGMMTRVIPENIQLTLDLAPDLDNVKADPSQIDQIVINLLVNARDAMPRGGRISIRTANRTLTASEESRGLAPGPYVELSVRDDGEGMSPEVRKRMFEPFFSTKVRGRGTGLGLATVFGIVKQSGGEIAVESAAGRGSEFRILLPAERVDRTSRTTDEADRVRGGSETILVAEDDEPVRRLVVEVLQDLGYSVLAARDGLAAARMAKERNGDIDLLLTDLVMPGQSGTELAIQLREAHPDLRVVYMSGYAHESIAEEASEMPRDRFLAKPFTTMTLGHAIREALD